MRLQHFPFSIIMRSS